MKGDLFHGFCVCVGWWAVRIYALQGLAALRKALTPWDGTDAVAITLIFEQFAGSDAVLPPHLLSKVPKRYSQKGLRDEPASVRARIRQIATP